MKRFFFAVTVGFLVAASANADTPPVSGPAGTTAPAVGSTVPTPVVQNTLIQPPQRMGLFARLRARRTNPMLSTSVAYPATTSVAVPMPNTPMPMPTTPPATTPPATLKGTTSSATPSVTGMPVVAGTTPELMSTTTVPAKRMGLLQRLRMRRAY